MEPSGSTGPANTASADPKNMQALLWNIRQMQPGGGRLDAIELYAYTLQPLFGHEAVLFMHLFATEANRISVVRLLIGLKKIRKGIDPGLLMDELLLDRNKLEVLALVMKHCQLPATDFNYTRLDPDNYRDQFDTEVSIARLYSLFVHGVDDPPAYSELDVVLPAA